MREVDPSWRDGQRLARETLQEIDVVARSEGSSGYVFFMLRRAG